MAFELRKIIPPAAATEGIWLEFEGGKFLIASSKSNRFQKAVAKFSRKFTERERAKKPEIYLEITRMAIAEAVLLDWQNVESDGVPVAATFENKLAFLNVFEFREWVESQAREAETFAPEAVAEDAAAIKSKP